MLKIIIDNHFYDFSQYEYLENKNQENDVLILHHSFDVFPKQQYYEEVEICFCEVFTYYLYECSLDFQESTIYLYFNREISDIRKYICEWVVLWSTQQNIQKIWQNMNEEMQSEWLRFCFECQRIEKYPAQNMIIIDGLNFKTEMGFLCEIAEKTFGTFGYFGSSLWGFFDILTGGLRDICNLENNPQFRWINFAYSRQYLEPEILNTILDYFNQSEYEIFIVE